MQSTLKSYPRLTALAWTDRLSGAARPSGMLALAALLVACAFALGGSARPDVASLQVLRPLAAIALGIALLNVRREHIRNYRLLLSIALACIALAALHLAPLPPGVAGALAGRDLAAEIDASAGLASPWRPLSMWAPATQNALWAALVPLSLLAACIQLTPADLARLPAIVLAAGAASAVIALLQTTGDPQGALYLYDTTNFGSAVGLFANRNHQAALLACLIPLTFAALQMRKSGRGASISPRGKVDTRTIGALAALAFLVPLILITGSRSGLVMGAVALLSLAALQPAGSKPAHAHRLWNSPKAKLALGLAAAAALVLLTAYLQRDLAIDRLTDGEAGEGMRSLILPAMADMIGLYQPLGAGVGTFREVYGASEPASLLREFYMNQAHNDWLDVALTGGLPGMAIAAAAIGAWIARAGQVFWAEAPDEFHALRKAGLIVLLILALGSLSDYPTRTPALACLLALAAVWAATPPARAPAGRPSDAEPLTPKIFDAQGN